MEQIIATIAKNARVAKNAYTALTAVETFAKTAGTAQTVMNASIVKSAMVSYVMNAENALIAVTILAKIAVFINGVSGLLIHMM